MAKNTISKKQKKNLIIVENSNKKPKTIPSNFKKVLVYLFLIFKYKFNYLRLICFFYIYKRYF
jgi:hypothetical protein